MPNPETLETVVARAAVVAGLRTQLQEESRLLRDAITAADRDGHSRNQIAKAAADGLSRKLVYEVLGAVDLATLATEALTAAGYGQRDYLIRADPRAAIALGTDSGEWSARPEQARLRLAEAIADALAEAGITVGDVGRLAEWEFTTITRADAPSISSK